VNIGFGKLEAMGCLFRLVNDFFNAVDDFALAGWAALMNAIVLVGIKFTIHMKHTDLETTLRDNFAIAVLKVLGLSDVQIRHLCPSSVTC
jgi:hypothetical protein